jgi:hypothetical protein
VRAVCAFGSIDLRAVDSVQRFDDWLTVVVDEPDEQGALAGAGSLVRGAGRRIPPRARSTWLRCLSRRARPAATANGDRAVGEAVSRFQFG